MRPICGNGTARAFGHGIRNERAHDRRAPHRAREGKYNSRTSHFSLAMGFPPAQFPGGAVDDHRFLSSLGRICALHPAQRRNRLGTRRANQRARQSAGGARPPRLRLLRAGSASRRRVQPWRVSACNLPTPIPRHTWAHTPPKALVAIAGARAHLVPRSAGRSAAGYLPLRIQRHDGRRRK